MSNLREFSDQLYVFHKNADYSSIETLYNAAKEYFLEELDKVDEKSFAVTRLKGRMSAEKKANLRSWMNSQIDRINEIVKRKSDNDMTAAFDFYKVLFRNDGKVISDSITSLINKSIDLFRMRSTDKYELYDRKGLFLISDNLENLVGDYRFNPSGYACLYLAPNIYLAWEECRRPDFDKVNFSRFEIRREVKVLNLTILRNMVYREQFLMAYLTLLCSAKTTDKDRHNYQYVVPHLMMEALCSSQRQMEKNSKTPIAGIKYLSSRRFDQKDFLFNDRNLSEAYVFPQRPHDKDKEVCPFLANLFYLTEPRSYFLYKTHSINFQNRKAIVSNYQESIFYKLEELTKTDKVDKWDK